MKNPLRSPGKNPCSRSSLQAVPAGTGEPRNSTVPASLSGDGSVPCGGLLRRFLLCLLLGVLSVGQAPAALNKVFFTSTHASDASLDRLFSANLDRSGLTTLASGTSLAQNPVRLAFDEVNNRIYVADSFNGACRVYRYDVAVSGTSVSGKIMVFTDNTAGITLGGVAVDAAAGYLFITTSSATAAEGRLYRCALDGAGTTVLLSGASLAQDPGDVAVDPVNQRVYVADRFNSASAITRCGYDGSGGTSIFTDSTSGSTLQGLAVDPSGGFVYFLRSNPTASEDRLMRCGLGGERVTTLVSGASIAAAPAQLALDRANNQFFLTDEFSAAGGVFGFTTSPLSRPTIYSNSTSGVAMAGVAVGTAAPLPPDYTVTTNVGTAITVTDTSGNGDTLTISQPGAGNIAFAATGRSFSVNGGPPLNGASGTLPLTGINRITVNAAGGNDVIDIGGLGNFPADLTLNGGTGDDTVNFKGNINFAADRNLDVDLQNDGGTPGTDSILFTTNSKLRLQGNGHAVLKASRDIWFNGFSGLLTVDGDITLEANQQAVPTGGDFTAILIRGSTAVGCTGGGVVTLKGRSGDATINGAGVEVRSFSRLLGGTAAGRVVVEGTGGAGTTEGLYGVRLGGEVNSNGAEVSVTGQGGGSGAAGSAVGIYCQGLPASPALISAGGSGSVTLVGRGGPSSGGGLAGVTIGLWSRIGSSGGDVTVTGSAGENSTVGDSVGVGVFGNESEPAQIKAGGAGIVRVTGIAPPLMTTAASINLSAPTAVSSGGGAVILEGNGGNVFFNTAACVSTATNGGDVTVMSDAVTWGGTATIVGNSTSTITILPRTAGRAIGLGGAGSATQLGFLDADLDKVTGASRLVIGDSTTGPVTVTADISRATATNLKLVSGGDISLTTGAINTAGGTLLLDAGTSPAAVKPGKSGTDVTASTLTLASGGVLFLDISGSTVDTGYQQLKVTGAVDLTGTTLKLSGDYTPAGTDSFTLVDNDSSDPITGTFTDLAEGAGLSFNGVPMVISYTGGDGNDVVLSLANHAPTDLALSSASLEENNAPDATVGTLSATDADSGDSLTFTLVSGSGDADNGSFSLTGNVLKLTPAADFETKSSYSLRVQADDGHGGTFSKELTVSITDVTYGLAIAADSASTPEGHGGYRTDFTFTVTRSGTTSGAASVSYAVTAGTADAADFGGTLPSGTVTIPAGKTRAVLTIPVSDDSSVEPDETFTVTLSAPSADYILTTASASATIANNDARLSLVADHSPAVFGQMVTFTATVDLGSATASGTVSFKDGSTVIGSGMLSGGIASFSTSSLSVGSHSVSADHVDETFGTISSSGFTQLVNQAATTTALGTSGSPSLPGQSVTFTATVRPVAPGEGIATGSVTFMDGTTTLGTVSLVSGVAEFTTTALAAGNHNITASYGGDVNFTGSSSSGISQFVGVNTIAIQGGNNQSATVNTAFASALKVLVKNAADAPLAGASVTFTAPATGASGSFAAIATVTTDGSGIATAPAFTAGTVSGSYTVTATSDVVGAVDFTLTNKAAAATHFLVTGPATADAGDLVSYTVTAKDAYENTDAAYPGTVRFTSSDSLALLPAETVLVSGSGSFSVIYHGGGIQTLTATDTLLSAVTGTSGPIAVHPAPVITGQAPLIAVVGQPLTLTLADFTATDAESRYPSGFTLSVFDGTGYSRVGNAITPDISAISPLSVRVKINDGRLDSEPFTAAVTVDHAPTLADVADSSTNEDTATSLAIAFTVEDDLTPVDSLTVTASSDNPALVPNLPANLTLGGIGADGRGTLIVTPAADQSGTATITLTVTDASGLTATDTFELTVNAVNDAPTLAGVPDPAPVNEDAAEQTVNLSGINVGGGTVESAQTLTVTAAVTTNPGLLSMPVISHTGADATGTLKYTPVPDAFGTAVITVTVKDDGGTADGGVDTVTRTFTVTVHPVNDMPSFTAGTNQTIVAGDSAARTVPGWATGISDGDAGTVQALSFRVTVLEGVSLFTAPPEISADGTLTYTPGGTSGTARISVTLTDDGSIGGTPALTTAAREFTISVNRAPVPKADTLGTVRNTPVMVIARKFALNDRDPDGDAISITAVSAASARGGSATLILGTLTYIPPSGFAGEDSFTYTLTDARGATAEGTVKVTVADEGAISRNSSIQQTADGFELRFAGIPGNRYTIEYSSELTSGWTTLIGPVTADEQGVIDYTDNPQPRPARRFYRTISAP